MGLEIRDRIAGKLRQMVSAMDKGERDAEVLAIASSKGGVGKTTTSVNLAVGFAKSGVKTLLVDLDPQAHVAASLNLDSVQRQALSPVLMSRGRDVVEAAAPTRWDQLDVAGSEKSLAETETLMSAKIGKELILTQALTIARTHYDLIIIDCPPNLGTLTLNALCAADHLLIPSDMSVLALEGVGDILSAVETCRTHLGRHVEVCGVVITRFDRRTTRVNASLERSFADLHGDVFFDTRIPQSAAINRAHMAGKPVLEFARTSPGAVAYQELTQEVATRLGLQTTLVKAQQVAAAVSAK